MAEETASSSLNFRPPSSSPAASARPASFEPPPLDFLQGLWHVTHSTFPMWKSNRNVTVTYTLREFPAGTIDDLVEYQPLRSDKHKSVEGIDTPDAKTSAAYTWRGKGWLRIASSRWEILGYGSEDGGWAVTFFQKTLVSPAGIDIYARRRGGLSEDLLDRIKAEIKAMNDPALEKQVEQIFEIKFNW